MQMFTWPAHFKTTKTIHGFSSVSASSLSLLVIPIRRSGRRGPRAAHPCAGVGRPSSADLVDPFVFAFVLSFFPFPVFFFSLFSLVFSFLFYIFLKYSDLKFSFKF
jgi:hypothetical protein